MAKLLMDSSGFAVVEGCGVGWGGVGWSPITSPWNDSVERHRGDTPWDFSTPHLFYHCLLLLYERHFINSLFPREIGSWCCNHDFNLNRVHSTSHMTILLIFQRILSTKNTKEHHILLLAPNKGKAF